MFDVISMNDFSRKDIDIIFEVTDDIRRALHSKSENKKFKKKYGRPVNKLLKGLNVAALFRENSTRTNFSSRIAVGGAGGFIDGFPSEAYTSLKKGETWAHTVAMFAGLGYDAIIMRSTTEGLPRWTKESLIQGHQLLTSQHADIGEPFGYRVPIVINGGDGKNQHPTQCLLDLYTMRMIAKSKGKSLDGSRVALLNDLAHGRTVSSLMSVAHLFDLELHLANAPRFGVKHDKLRQLKDRGVIVYEHNANFLTAMMMSDFAYQTRPQSERVAEGKDLETIRDLGQITLHMYEKMKDKAPYLMHPLPIDAVQFAEIHRDMDLHPLNFTRLQAMNGRYIRTALLALGLGRIKVDGFDGYKAIDTELIDVAVGDLRLSAGDKDHRLSRTGYIEGTGVVLDHIPAGMSRRLEGMLGFEGEQLPIIRASYLPVDNGREPHKDMLKIHCDYKFTNEQFTAMALIAPDITITYVVNGAVDKKVRPRLGNHITGRVACGNYACVTNDEREHITTQHRVEKVNGDVSLMCDYCETPDTVQKAYAGNRFEYITPQVR